MGVGDINSKPSETKGSEPKGIETKGSEIKGPGEEMVTLTFQEKYHSDQLGFLMMILVVMVALVVGFFGLFITVIQLQNPSPVYFPATARNELLPEFPLDKPNIEPNALLNWVTEAMMDSTTFNFVNYNQVLENARDFFTSEGYDYFIKALQANGVIDKVINNKFALRSRPTSAPQVTKEGILANRYLWKIKVKMNFDYRNADNVSSDDAEIVLLVMRVPNSQYPFGVRILKYDLTLKRI
jgi:intracellular multiplication protein IcmL